MFEQPSCGRARWPNSHWRRLTSIARALVFDIGLGSRRGYFFEGELDEDTEFETGLRKGSSGGTRIIATPYL